MATSAFIADVHYGYFFHTPDWHNQCKDSPYWDGWYPRLRVAVFAIGLVNYVLCLPILTLRSRRRHVAARSILSWTGFLPAIIATAIWLFVIIVADCYLNCIRISAATYLRTMVAVRVFNHLGNILLLGVISFQLVPAMWKRIDQNIKIYRICMIMLYTLIVLFAVAGITLRSYLEVNMVTGGAHKIKDKHSGTFATFITLYLVGTIISSAAAMSACWNPVRKQCHTLDCMLPKAAALFIFFVGLGIINMITTMRYEVCLTNTFTKSASTIIGILYLVFQAASFATVCWMAATLPNSRNTIHEEKVRQRDSADNQPNTQGEI